MVPSGADAVVGRCRAVTKRYGPVTALDAVDVDIPAGLVGLVGANGAGKTTLFRVLLGQTTPDAGSVEVAGIDVLSDPVGVRSRLGYMPEHDCLPLDQTAADVVATFGELGGLPPRAARSRASEVLDLVGLDEARFRPVGDFSTGMRQRAKLAQAIVAGPALVLLDEPTAGLDPTGRREMLGLVARLGSFGISVVLATHLLDDVARVCDHVVVLDQGRVARAASTDALLHQTGVVTVDVGEDAQPLLQAITRAGLAAQPVGTTAIAVEVHGDGDFDGIRDAVADLGLPLYRMSSRYTTLDDAFVEDRP